MIHISEFLVCTEKAEKYSCKIIDESGKSINSWPVVKEVVLQEGIDIADIDPQSKSIIAISPRIGCKVEEGILICGEKIDMETETKKVKEIRRTSKWSEWIESLP